MGSISLPVAGRKSYGRLTQSFGTKIVRLCEPRKGKATVLASLTVRVGTSNHILSVLRPLGKTTFSAAAAAAQAVVNITADPGLYATTGTVSGNAPATADNALAGSDWVAYQAADGTWVVDTVSSVSTLAITLTTNLPTGGVLKGGDFWFFGVETDTNPNDNQAHPRYNLLASTNVVLGDSVGEGAAGWQGSIPGVMKGLEGGLGHPLVLVIDNGTNASNIEETTVVHTDHP